ncbi:MAG: TerC family protein [Pseudomonadota bacterium]|nr:TerC family protein [Pseudomonadota bacterium]
MSDLSSLLVDPAVWAALATLVVMELALGIDNLLFLSILTNRVDPARRAAARRIGLGLALGLRLALLAAAAWVMRLDAPLFALAGNEISWKDLLLIGGGLFLCWKATVEIHERVGRVPAAAGAAPRAALGFAAAVGQILALDLVFSVDSIITAVGMTPHLPVMCLAMVIAVAAMFRAAGPLARFVERQPGVAMLALAFLLMIGMVLVADGLGFHVPRGYLYAAMGFSMAVEALNILGGGRGASRPAERGEA